ncbi:hypothetical protein chiPu_0025669, partial [Chiloscyllium punctatum]|nr:hypothetical protein [Chiloscyllium punctatum]
MSAAPEARGPTGKGEGGWNRKGSEVIPAADRKWVPGKPRAAAAE